MCGVMLHHRQQAAGMRHPADQPERLQAIHELFGQIADTLEDVWVKVDLNDEAEIAELIDQTTATRNPFDKKYSRWKMPPGKPVLQC